MIKNPMSKINKKNAILIDPLLYTKMKLVKNT